MRLAISTCAVTPRARSRAETAGRLVSAGRRLLAVADARSAEMADRLAGFADLSPFHVVS
jgi:hypothetical protein